MHIYALIPLICISAFTYRYYLDYEKVKTGVRKSLPDLA